MVVYEDFKADKKDTTLRNDEQFVIVISSVVPI